MSDFDLYSFYDETEPDEGFEPIVSSLVPTGKYPVEIVYVNTGVSSNNNPYTDLRLKVLEGPFKDSTVRTRVYWPNVFDPAFQDALGRWKAGERDDEEVKRMHGRWARLRGFFEAIGVQPRRVSPGPDTAQATLEFLATDKWVGLQFLGGLRVETAEAAAASMAERGVDGTPRDRQQLSSWSPMTPENLAKWRERDLPAQEQIHKQIAAGMLDHRGLPVRQQQTQPSNGGSSELSF